MDIRCPSKKHALLIVPTADPGVIEVKCDSRWCGAISGVVVLHRFSTRNGELLNTRKFRQPPIGG